MPLFVKSGSIIPYYTSVEKNINVDVPLEIHVFGGENASFNLYEDDGETLKYKMAIIVLFRLSGMIVQRNL